MQVHIGETYYLVLRIIYSSFKYRHSKRTIKGTFWRQEEACTHYSGSQTQRERLSKHSIAAAIKKVWNG